MDNASPDRSAEVVSERFPSARLLEPGDNLGFARAVDLAAHEARGRWLLLLNPDTEALPGSLDALVDFGGRKPQAGIVGGRTLSEDGSVDPSSCWGLPTLWSRVCFALGLSTAFRGNRFVDPESLGRWERDSEREVGMVTGCLALIDRQLWNAIDGFDQRFWMYGEDADLNLRLRRLGYRPAITPEATIVHAVGASAPTRGDKRVQVLRSKVTLDRLHAPAWQRTLRVALLALGAWLRARLAARRDDSGDGWPEAWERRAEWLDGYPAVTS